MTAQSDPFVRVYYSVMGDDEKFAQVYDDDARLACWLRLLLVADACYPAPAPLPHGIKKAPLNHLVTVGLVDLLPGNRYRIHGLQAEREKRSERAAASARKRWSDANAMQPHSDRTAEPMRRNANPNLSEPIQSEPSLSSAPAFDVMLLVEDLTRRPFNYREGHQVHDTLVGDVAAHGADKVTDAYRDFQRSASGPIDAAQLVFGVHKALHPLPRTSDVDAARRESETEAQWKRRVEASRRANADMREAMGYAARD